jgi:hypothetical protein
MKNKMNTFCESKALNTTLKRPTQLTAMGALCHWLSESPSRKGDSAESHATEHYPVHNLQCKTHMVTSASAKDFIVVQARTFL